jgi:hypothetical protein
MSESYRNVGIWTGPVRTIPLVIEVTSPKKPYLYSRVAPAFRWHNYTECAPSFARFSRRVGGSSDRTKGPAPSRRAGGIEDAQLEGRLASREEAMEFVRREFPV